MGYCGTGEVRAMVKDDAVGVILQDEYIQDPAKRERMLRPILAEAVSDAEAEIDGYLAKRYPVPLDPVPPVIAKLAKDIAVYNLFARVGISEDDRTKTYLTRYNAAVAYLRLVAEGKVDVAGAAGSSAAPSGGGYKIRAQRRLFTRDGLEGM